MLPTVWLLSLIPCIAIVKIGLCCCDKQISFLKNVFLIQLLPCVPLVLIMNVNSVEAQNKPCFFYTLLHATNPVIAPCINMRTALSKSDLSILHVFQCWSSLRCQRNPVHSSAGNPLFISLPSCWQGRYGSCQCIPLSPPPCLLLRETWRHFQRYGCPVAFWEMQSFVSDRHMAKWSEQHWNHVTECHWGTASCNNNAVLCIFVPIHPLSILPLSLFSSSFLSLILLLRTRDLKKVGVTIVGPQKIVSSLKALESHTKNGPVPV